MTDRAATTGKVWHGLTMGCAQCHTHKFDPITQREYYQFMAFLNNADEPELDVPRPEIAAQRAQVEAEIAALVADLPNLFPLDVPLHWYTPLPANVVASTETLADKLEDGSLRFPGHDPQQITSTIVIDTMLGEVAALRLEVLPDSPLPGGSPGHDSPRRPVLNEITVMAEPRHQSGPAQAVKILQAEADPPEEGNSIARTIDGDPKTGWVITRDDSESGSRTATFLLEKPWGFAEGTRWTIRLHQPADKQQTLSRLRVGLGRRAEDTRSVAVRQREHLEDRFEKWLQREAARTVRWTVLRPAEAKANLPLLTVLDDHSVLASGDQTKNDSYQLRFRGDFRGITAIRLEVLPDERLPKHGPGRVYYEGPFGDFHLSEFSVTVGGQQVPIVQATHSYASGKSTAATAIDGDPQTGWSINGGQGRAHTAVFHLARPLDCAEELGITLLFERYYAAGLGRFRIAVTTDQRFAAARDLPIDTEELLLSPSWRHTPEQRRRLLEHFLLVTPELADARKAIDKLRKELPAHPTTLVLTERPPANPRPTYVHHRGEFLQPTERVEPDVLTVLHPFPKGTARSRLAFARWLVSPDNPLVGRVTMNRQWAALFGQGLVRTVDDFGYQGELPSHPELLDWLAVEFVNQGWSLKQMHKLIVMSATYQQASRVTPELLARDPGNRWLARGPRVRLEAELIRDAALRSSGLLAPQIGGPSVFPPQPPSVTTEGAYGKLEWKVSEGADRYRRGLYTFSKRTAPYAMLATFDGPSGEACVAQREVSNTPLQALTLMNDLVFMEAAQALGRMMAAQPGPIEERVEYLFRRCFARPPKPDETGMLIEFYQTQKQRFDNEELDAAAIAGAEEGDVNERAAWTTLARALFNLDEMITKD
jgi:hypothetical protein